MVFVFVGHFNHSFHFIIGSSVKEYCIFLRPESWNEGKNLCRMSERAKMKFIIGINKWNGATICFLAKMEMLTSCVRGWGKV